MHLVIALLLATLLAVASGSARSLPAVRARSLPIMCSSAGDDPSDELWASLRQRVGATENQAAPPRPSVRPISIRPDGLIEAGLHYGDARLASTTGPVFDADDLPAGQILSPAQAIKGLYAAFNARDAACVASFLTEDCVYEDLLLGPATVCRGKDAFLNALQFHPAFVSDRVLGRLPFAELLPDLTLEVDSIAEGVDTVGVEWHVQCGDSAFPLGRGLSQARVCRTTGKIERVVDIAEAPWRVIGLLALPFISLGQRLLAQLGTKPPSAPSTPGTLAGAAGGDGEEEQERYQREYSLMLGAVLADGIVTPSERAMLDEYAAQHAVGEGVLVALLERAGWSADEYREGCRRS